MPPLINPSKPIGMRFNFIEVCGGAAKVSREVEKRGWIVGPCIDLDRSPHFNLASLEVIAWLIHLIETDQLDAYFVQPPCTTFRPAAYPPVRSYSYPRGFIPSDPKTHLGTTLGLRALTLTLMMVSARSDTIGLLEQSRRSKMAWLPEWIFLREAGWVSEEWLASCMYGSPHQKEFRLLGTNIDLQPLHRKCDHSHCHIKIEGKWTKPSATYVDDLATAFGWEISKALRRKTALREYRQIDTTGLESPLFNDILATASWSTRAEWTWKKPARINIHEAAAVLKLLQSQACSRPCSRFSVGSPNSLKPCRLPYQKHSLSRTCCVVLF